MTKEELSNEDDLKRLKRRALSQSTQKQDNKQDEIFQTENFNHDYHNFLDVKKQIRLNSKSTRNSSLSSESPSNIAKTSSDTDNNNNLVNRRKSSINHNHLHHIHRATALIPLKNENFFTTVLLFLKNQTQFLTFTFIVIISVLTNSIYFNFYYLPSLTHLNHQHQSVHKQKQIEKVDNSVIEPRLPYLSYVNQDNLKNENFKSYDHVVFPTIVNHNQHHGSDQSSQQHTENDLKIESNMDLDLFKREGHIEASPVAFNNNFNEVKGGDA